MVENTQSLTFEDTRFKLERHQKVYIEKFLEKLDYIQWDRFLGLDGTGVGGLQVYGWMKNKDSRFKDFIVLAFRIEPLNINVSLLATSSVEFHEKFEKFSEQKYRKCKRIEDHLKIKNSIKLKKKKK